MCLSLLTGASTAWARTPVLPEQMLCGGEYIFAGQVIAVANKDCRLGPVPATCKQDRMNDVELRIVVARLMGARKTAQGLRVGQTITAQSSTYTSPFCATRVLVWPPDKAEWARDTMARPEKLFGGDCFLPL